MDEERQPSEEMAEHGAIEPAAESEAAIDEQSVYSVSAARFQEALEDPGVQARIARAREILRRRAS